MGEYELILKLAGIGCEIHFFGHMLKEDLRALTSELIHCKLVQGSLKNWVSVHLGIVEG